MPRATGERPLDVSRMQTVAVAAKSSKSHAAMRRRAPTTCLWLACMIACVATIPSGRSVAGAAAVADCQLDSDCQADRICHESKCICVREKPIDFDDQCLPQSLIGEPCTVNEQCMGQSFCYDQICSCGQEALSYKNPTNNIEYCHPKRRLHEECNYDSQCPANAYCSSQKLGCLCQNGYGSATVGSASGTEQAQCLPKTCRVSSDCESEFHRCEQDTSSSARLCMCVATHFDPTSAKCYKFGAQGGKSTDVSNNLLASNKTDATTTTTAAENNNNNKYSILDDLISKIRDNKLVMWLVLIVALVVFVIFVVLALLMLLYKDGHCWTTHKKEYEPHSDKHDTAKNGFLNKNKSINQKSFRQKSADALESANHDDAAAASSADDLLGSGHTAALEAPTTTTTATLEQNGKAKQYNNLGGSLLHSNIASKDDDRYVKVSLVKSTQQQQQYQHHVSVPLETSTSTPV